MRTRSDLVSTPEPETQNPNPYSNPLNPKPKSPNPKPASLNHSLLQFRKPETKEFLAPVFEKNLRSLGLDPP